MPRCVEAPWHIKNTKVDEAGCVETPWHVEPYPFVAIHVENRRGGVEPSPFTAIRIENRGGFEPPHFDPGKVVSRKREKKECCGTPLVPAFPFLIVVGRSKWRVLMHMWLTCDAGYSTHLYCEHMHCSV
jgi:hypothetical protein